MNKKEFLDNLRVQLETYKIADVDDLVNYHDEIISELIESGKDESDVIANYQSVQSIISELTDDTKNLKGFRFSDYVLEKSNTYFAANSLIEPITKNGVATTKIPIDDQSKLKIDLIRRDAKIISSDITKDVLVESRGGILSKIESYKQGDDLLIKEKRINLAVRLLLYFIPMIAVMIGASLLWSHLIENDRFWHHLILLIVVAHLYSTVIFLFNLSFKNKKQVTIILPRDLIIGQIDLFIKSSTVLIDKVACLDKRVRILSGKLIYNDSYFDNLNLKVSSGVAIFGGESRSFSRLKKRSNLDLTIRSGKVVIYGLEVNNLKSTCTSGALRLNDSKFNTALLKTTSGSVKGYGLNFNEGTFIVRSGSVKIDDLSFVNGLFKVTSGKVKLNDIKGSINDYNLSARSRSGIIKLNNNNFNSYGYKLVKELPVKNIDANVTSGVIKLNFKDDIK